MTDGRPHPNSASGLPGRLRTREEFLAVRKGERRKGPFFLLEVNARGSDGPPRVGYTVTKKQGNAVERNRMRRRLREAVRLAGGFAMKPGHDYVIVARRDALNASFSRLTSALEARIEGRDSGPGGRRGTKGPHRSGASETGRADENIPAEGRHTGRTGTRRPSGTNDGQ